MDTAEVGRRLARGLVRVRYRGRELFSQVLEERGHACLVLAKPWDENDTYELEPGSPLAIGLLVPGGVEWRQACVLDPDRGGFNVVVELLEPAHGVERRRDPRIPADGHVTVVTSAGESLPGRLVDLSASGLQVRLADGLPIGEAVRLVVELPGVEPVELTARVARVDERGEHGFSIELIPVERRRALLGAAFARRLGRAA